MLLKAVFAIQVLSMMTLIPNRVTNGEEILITTDVKTTSFEPSEEDLTTMIKRYVAYNHWANQEYANWLSTASEEQLNLEIVSSYANLKETVIHIWSAEYLWLKVVKDESYENSPAKNFSGSKEDLLKGWIEASENFNNQVQSMTLEDLQEQRHQ